MVKNAARMRGIDFQRNFNDTHGLHTQAASLSCTPQQAFCALHVLTRSLVSLSLVVMNHEILGDVATRPEWIKSLCLSVIPGSVC